MLIFQEASLRELLNLYPTVWDIPAQATTRRIIRRSLSTGLPSRTFTITTTKITSNIRPGVPVVDSPMDKDINSLSEDPHHTIPSPPGLNSHAQYDAYADNAMGTGPGSDKAGGHFIGDTGWSEDGARMSFQDQGDYGRQPSVLKVNITLLSRFVCSHVFCFH